MSNVRAFGKRAPVRQSSRGGGSGMGAFRQPVRIPLSVIALAFCAIFALGYSFLPQTPSLPQTSSAVAPSRGLLVSETFPYCNTGQGFNCIIDGDTFRYQGQSIRIADINTPETYRSECAAEKALGDRATRRMHALLNAGPFEIAAYERDTDKYGRQLRLVMRDGQSLGMVLVSEGLAEAWKGYRSSWCG